MLVGVDLQFNHLLVQDFSEDVLLSIGHDYR